MTSFAITKVYTSRRVGGVEQPYTPTVGEPYRLTAEFQVSGTPRNPYQVWIGMADRYSVVEIGDLTPGAKQATAQFSLPLDGLIPWEVDVDAFHLADAVDPTKSKIPPHIPDLYGTGSQAVASTRPVVTLADRRTLKGSFKPAPPVSAVDYYNPVWAIGAQSQLVDFKQGGHLDRITIMAGRPETASWQKLLSGVCRAESAAGDELVAQRPVENPSFEPVYYWNRTNLAAHNVSLIQQYALKLQSVRVDAAKLRTITWAELDGLDVLDVFHHYRSPEAVVESKDPKITDFVTQTLGANHRSKYKPYDAARKLFQAVLKHTTYYYPAAGQPDKRPSTAVGMVDAGFGDCGGFSILLVALYRNIGFPARVACGAWLGEDAGHCWCELYFPGHGWVVSDGSAGNGMSETGEYAYYFGNIPDLNARFATMRGNTFNVADVETSWLQGPYGPLVSGSAQVTSVVGHTSLLEVTEAEAESLGQAPAAQLMAAANAPETELRRSAAAHCPCSQHGGFTMSGRLPVRVAAQAGPGQFQRVSSL
jgi:transglutaminase-like putative cysteine protease